MPFTLAHPAAALPLSRPLGRLGVPVALAAGSVAPDLAYFLPLSVSRGESHSPAALLWFCLPVGLAAYVVFHLLVAPLLAPLLPGAARRRLPAHWAAGGLPHKPLAAVALCVLVGAVTHLIWDSFTHGSGAVVQAVPSLRQVLLRWEGYTLFAFKGLQHASTLLGIGLLATWATAWLRAAPERDVDASLPLAARAVLLAVLVLPAFVIGASAGWQHTNAAGGRLYQLQLFAGGAVFAGGRTALACLLAVGLAWRLHLARRPARA